MGLRLRFLHSLRNIIKITGEPFFKELSEFKEMTSGKSIQDKTSKIFNNMFSIFPFMSYCVLIGVLSIFLAGNFINKAEKVEGISFIFMFLFFMCISINSLKNNTLAKYHITASAALFIISEIIYIYWSFMSMMTG